MTCNDPDSLWLLKMGFVLTEHEQFVKEGFFAKLSVQRIHGKWLAKADIKSSFFCMCGPFATAEQALYSMQHSSIVLSDDISRITENDR